VKGRTQLPGMVEDAMAGKIQLDPFITHRLPLEQINEAFDLMHEGNPFVPSSISATTNYSASGFAAGLSLIIFSKV
jgi:hypothetical protein